MVHQIPLSIVILSIIVPIVLSRRPRPRQAIRTLWLTMAFLAFVWTMLCMHVYTGSVLPE
jgi:hypothetical protein